MLSGARVSALQKLVRAFTPRQSHRGYRAAMADREAPVAVLSPEPAWVAELAATPGITSLSGQEYWKSDEPQVHGEDTVISLLHDGGEEPALTNTARVFLDAAKQRVYTVWPLGRRVCGHPGIVHGGVTALILDESFGQAYWAWCAKERGPGFTANLTVDYKSPLSALTWVCTTIDMVSVEGRKVRLSATVSDRPGGVGGTIFATASCLFIVAAKEAPPS